MPGESFAPHKLFERLATMIPPLTNSLPDEQRDTLNKDFGLFFVCISLLNKMENSAAKRQECSEVTGPLYEFLREVKQLKKRLADTPLLATSDNTSEESSECSALCVSSLSPFESDSSSFTPPGIAEILRGRLRPTTQLPGKHTVPKPEQARLEEPSGQSIIRNCSRSESDNETDNVSLSSFDSSCGPP